MEKYQLEQTVPAFSLSREDLSELFRELAILFGTPNKVKIAIEIVDGKSSMKFGSLAELFASGRLPSRVTRFKIVLSGAGNSIEICSDSFIEPSILDDFAKLKVVGTAQAWCVDALSIAKTFFAKNKRWYSSLLQAIVGNFYFFFFIPGYIISILIYKNYEIMPLKYVISLLQVLMVLWIPAYFFRAKILPAATIVFNREESVIRQYSVEFSLALALVSSILTVIGWFVN